MKEKVKGLFKRLRQARGPKKPRKMSRKKKLLTAAAGLILFLALITAAVRQNEASAVKAQSQRVNTATVIRQNITSTLSSSGTISPKDTYSITSMSEGEVVQADFEEGDRVEAGQILYRIDASSMESKLSSASNSLERAQSSYDTAVSDYNEAVGKYSGNTYKATKSGYIKQLYIEAGDKVASNTQIADIYNDQIMKIKVPFLNMEAAAIAPGSPAVLTLSDTLEQLDGTVLSVSSMDEALTGGRLVRYVTIQVANPGGLTADMTATAAVGDFVSSGDGTFSATVDTVLAADLSSNVEVEALLVNEGDFVSVGSPIFSMKASTAEKLIKTYKDSMDNAQASLEQAQSSLDSTQDTYDDYTITAPISGTVIKKSYKVGDKVQNGSSASALAVIYDMSSVTFQMNIDELDISSVKTGQTVEVTADAFENEKFSGKVTNISLEGTSSNGVTYYPVTVTLDEVGGLLPGMNVDGVIIVDSVENALAVPADALQRGNLVYVKDDSVTEAQGRVPAGFREVKVGTGLISSDYVEIVSGDLQEGDVVYVAKSSVNSDSGAMMMMPVGMDMPSGGGGYGDGGGSRGSGNGSRPGP
ncbi:efflux RND transporter periplasmic adaptor subunit [[Clostridium] symbiosum]|uniref:efflux RND transporter periplasmic adaptor subunit n=1 Tax=Clostridium symbiosum TaxID=1512 RepID=UPI00210E9AB9|nr:efflux RND transporter periplasmic adaptor subunit [[Clostridium] symbiosum]MCQ4987913.1 efflux RND transporter periplasmic adaptor subunit [[Clostridium] symbiosum]